MSFFETFCVKACKFGTEARNIFYGSVHRPETPGGRFSVGVLIMLIHYLSNTLFGTFDSLYDNVKKYRRFVTYNYDMLITRRLNTHVVLPNSNVIVLCNERGIEFLDKVSNSLDLDEFHNNSEQLDEVEETTETAEADTSQGETEEEIERNNVKWEDVIDNLWRLSDIESIHSEDGTFTYSYVLENDSIREDSIMYNIDPSLCKVV
jgi:hypothetical protein